MRNNTKLLSLGIAFALCTGVLQAQDPWQSKLLKMSDDGSLTYVRDADGFVLPDFSQAGYKNGEPIPVVDLPDRTETISPLPDASADNTAHIQAAINKVGAYTPDGNGIRGVVLLKAGRYNVDGTINMTYPGVILRGEGNCYATTDSTVLFGRNAKEKAKRLILMGYSSAHNWGNGSGSNRTNVTTEKVMPGDYSLNVADASAYKPGDLICVKYPTTEAWLEAVWYGGNSNRNTDASMKWKTSDVDMSYHRYVTKVEGNTITLDAPLFYTLDKTYSQAYIYKINNTTTIRHNIGIENLHISFERTPSTSKVNVDQNCIYMSSLENSWVKGVSLTGFIHAGIKITSTTRTTIEDCYSIDPSGLCTGGTYYNFETYHRSQLVLLKNCYGRNGRHHYLSNGCATVSGIVVQNFRSELALASSEGHRLWSQGILFDNWKEVGTVKSNAGKIGMFLRDNMGSGHGWGGTNSVFWNCDVQQGMIYLDKVPTGQNYAIGCTANTIRKYRNTSVYTTGYIEGQKKKGLQPQSLYDAQLAARKKATGITIAKSDEQQPRVSAEKGRVVISSETMGHVNIYNVNGTQLQSFAVTTGNAVKSHLLASGVYVVNVQTKGGTDYTTKVYVE